MRYVFIKSPNFWKGRKGCQPEAIVIHITDAPRGSVVNAFKNPFFYASAHYLVCKNGDLIQFVKEEDSAWHAGKVVNPKWKLLKQGVNPNLYTIGIEFEGFDNEYPTLEQAIVGSFVIASASQRWGIPIDTEHIIPHNWIHSGKICPGLGINVGALAWLAEVIKKQFYG